MQQQQQRRILECWLNGQIIPSNNNNKAANATSAAVGYVNMLHS